MAVSTPLRRSKDPEGRMPLRGHLIELRRRLLISALGIVVGAVVAWFYVYNPLLEGIQRPLLDVAKEKGIDANVNFGDIGSSFNIKIKLSIYVGLVLASPIWLYQVWAFIVPGLKRKEKRYALAFVGAAVPLFGGGVTLAWFVLPNAVRFLVDFVPNGSSSLVDAQSYLTFATRLILVFGVAFVIPLLLVALNLAGVLSGRALARSWRIAVFLIFLFSAIASPSPDAGSMLILAFALVALFMTAVIISLLVDRSRARRRDQDPIFGLADDESSPLDAGASPLDSGAAPFDYTPEPLDDRRPTPRDDDRS